jgi:ribonuclease-3
VAEHPWGRGGNLDRLHEIAALLGYAEGELGRLACAVTHRSYSNEATPSPPHNERLEFLGDAVLDLLVAEELMKAHPNVPEGDLSRLRAGLVNAHNLAGLARLLDIGIVLRLGRGEERSGGRRKDSLLADAYEAILGAVYLDLGLDAVRRRVCLDLGADIGRGTVPTPEMDHKSALQEWVQARHQAAPSYRPLREEGPDHEKLFFVEVLVMDSVVGLGQGRSKKSAERDAARMALLALRRPEGAD